MTRELQPHHLTGYSLSAFDLWKREMEMQWGNGLTEQKTLPPDDAMPAVTGCCLTVKEVIEWGGRGEGCLALPPSTLVSEYVFFWSRCFGAFRADMWKTAAASPEHCQPGHLTSESGFMLSNLLIIHEVQWKC